MYLRSSERGLYRPVDKADSEKLFDVLMQAAQQAWAMPSQGAQAVSPSTAFEAIASGAVSAVWIRDHTLLVYSVQSGSWCSTSPRTLHELLVFKYKNPGSASFSSVIRTLDALARELSCSVVVVGTGLTNYPARLAELYRRNGYAFDSNILTKEIQ